MYDPIELTEKVRPLVVNGKLRRYYRAARGGRWYGGIATADCTGCNLRCVFCWSGEPRDNPFIGKFYLPQQIFSALDNTAKRRGYSQVRVSGNEPTIGKDHLIELIELVEQAGYLFILETNGILIGYDKSYAQALSKFSKIHVRVSIKGTTPEEFSKLTGAKPESFELQLKALSNLLDAGVSCHPAVMLSFSSKEGVKDLVEKLHTISPSLVSEFEEEYVFLYPHVQKRLARAGFSPKISYRPDNIPSELI